MQTRPERSSSSYCHPGCVRCRRRRIRSVWSAEAVVRHWRPPSFSLLTSTGQRFDAEGFATRLAATCFYQCAPDSVDPMSSVSRPIEGCSSRQMASMSTPCMHWSVGPLNHAGFR